VKAGATIVFVAVIKPLANCAATGVNIDSFWDKACRSKTSPWSGLAYAS
jgi:hypothetical protein